MMKRKKIHFKWCKGCKKFLHLHAYVQKLGAVAKRARRDGPPKQPTKCDICRGRGRDAYRAKKGGGRVGAQETPAAESEGGVAT